MFNFLQILTAILIAVALALALMPLSFLGKCGSQRNFAMQSIYYPGFTIGGGIGEFGGLQPSSCCSLHLWECRILADAGGITRLVGINRVLAPDAPSESVLA